MRSTVYAANTEEALSVDEVKAFALRITSGDDDARIERLIVSARQAFEDYTGRILMRSTLDYYFDGFPLDYQAIKIPPPLVSIPSDGFTYKDTSGSWQSLSASAYVVDAVSEPGRITLAYGQNWPLTYDEINVVKIRCMCGWANAKAVPDRVKDGLYLFCQMIYDNVDVDPYRCWDSVRMIPI